MDSKPDSFFTPSISIQSVVKKSRSQTSTVWAHTRAAHDDEDSKFKYCTHCITFPIYSTNISSNMRMHLQRHHEINVEISVNRV